MDFSVCPDCLDTCPNENFVELLPCGCKVCIHCVLAMQVDATGPDDALVHCRQQVVKYIARKAIKKRKGVEMDTQEKEYPERQRRKLPPSKTVEFLRASMRESEPLKKIGNGLILTEQTLLEEFDGKPAIQPLSFSAVPNDGKDLDDIRHAGSQMKIEAAATLRMDKQANEGIKDERKYTGRSLK
jgi:hypothetical protein